MLFIFENRTFHEVHEDGLRCIQCGTLLRMPSQSKMTSILAPTRGTRDFQVYFLKLRYIVSISSLSLGSLGIGRHLDARSLT